MKALISTPCGQVQGIEHEDYLEFRGIRYAEAGRWEDPVQITHWDGVYDATKWGFSSVQHYGFFRKPASLTNVFYAKKSNSKGLEGFRGWSEDSLNLNIFVPSDACGAPVLIYMHGGAYVGGQNTDPYEVNGSFAKEGIVSVFINYRLNAFANALDETHSGNYCLKDQLTALRWVRDNISAFGGDPERITICGESAGAYSVQNLAASPENDVKLAGAIMMSGGGNMEDIGIPVSLESTKKIWAEFKQILGISSLDEAKEMDPAEVYKTWAPIAYKYSRSPAGPSVEGKLLVESTASALENNHVQNIPYMIGMLSEDMWPIVLYRAGQHFAEQRRKAGGKPVYLYLMSFPADEEFGAYHGADTSYAFRAIDTVKYTPALEKEAFKVQEDLFGRIKNFVIYGDPNGEAGSERTWLSAEESGGMLYELSGKDHKMVHPDTAKLEEQSKKPSQFPYAHE